ncbi:MAG: tRNA-uridine aminocarboxypropyltransferase [Planctomycetota bacterium]
MPVPTTWRPRCYRCLRPQPMCHCRSLPTVPTRTRIEILQHPHERTHPFGTARLVRLCLPNARVHVPWAGFTGTLEQRFEVPADAVVLYPRPGAPLVHELPVRPSTLIAIDGTWAHVRRLYRENAWLHGLPHAQLLPVTPSRYRIRQEPRAECVSTLEAIVLALRELEPATAGLDELLAAFDAMIDRQIAHAAVVQRFGRRKVARLRPSRTLSPLLADPRLAVVYAESSLPGGDVHGTRQLVHWVAARIDGDDTFEAVLRPEQAPPLPAHLAHMRLAPDEVAAGEVLTAAVARFRRWLGDGAPVAAWTPTMFDWGVAMLPPGAARTALKMNWCNLRNRRAGLLEQVLATEALAPVPLGLRGRAGDRLGNALAVARWLRDQRATPEPLPLVAHGPPQPQ